MSSLAVVVVILKRYRVSKIRDEREIEATGTEREEPSERMRMVDDDDCGDGGGMGMRRVKYRRKEREETKKVRVEECFTEGATRVSRRRRMGKMPHDTNASGKRETPPSPPGRTARR
jgi:hypothetical protein